MKYTFSNLLWMLIVMMSISCQKNDSPEPAKISSIIIKTNPAKTIYYNNEALDLSGLIITLLMDDGTSEDIADNNFDNLGITTSTANGAPVTTSAITITHSETNISAELVISVSNTVSNFSIKTLPRKIEYLSIEHIDLYGLVLTLTMDNGSTKDITNTDFEEEGISFSPGPEEDLTVSTNEIVISHPGTGTNETITISVNDIVMDVDENHYSYIKIGNQIWMKENLRVTKYPDGTPITYSGNDWGSLTNGNLWYQAAYFSYDSDQYGYLVYYTWAAAMGATTSAPAETSDSIPSGVQGLCPYGWHVPSDAEWKQLEIYLGMPIEDTEILGIERGSNEGSKLAGIDSLWQDGALKSDPEFDVTGFSASPNGQRYDNGTFIISGSLANWWSSTQESNEYAIYRSIHSNETYIRRRSYTKSTGFGVRCIRD